MYKEKKLNIKNLWCTKNEINFFVPDTNEILFIYLFIYFVFDTWLYFSCYVTIKTYHQHITFKWCSKEKFVVTRKTIVSKQKVRRWTKSNLLSQKQVGVARKSVSCQQKKLMLHKKKYFMSTKTRRCCTKKIFCIQKIY